MIPSQFHYRDLINFTLSGLILLLCIVFFIGDFFFNQTMSVLTFLNKNLQGIGGVIVVPIIIIFVISFMLGSFMGSCSNYVRAVGFNSRLREFPKGGWLGNLKTKATIKVLKIFIFFEGTTDEMNDRRVILFRDPANKHLAKALLIEKIKKQWDVNINDDKTTEELRDLFELCRSHVECQPVSLATTDIERHFVLMSFQARICFVFLLAMLLSGIELLIKFLQNIIHYNILETYSAQHVHWSFWFVALIVFWFIAYSSAFRCLRNADHWVRLVYFAFLNNEPTQKAEKPKS